MTTTLSPALLGGTLDAIPSKSDAHRVLICAALGDKEITFSLPARSADIDATIDCLCALGATISLENGLCRVFPITTPAKSPVLDCRESGSTLRFLLPIAAALGCDATFKGCGRLPSRPIGELLGTLSAHGVTASAPSLPLTLNGRLTGGEFTIGGDVSSQYITGLLLAFPLLGAPSRLVLSTPLQSVGYVDMTCRTMSRFGAAVSVSGNAFTVEADSYHTPAALTVEGDWSNAAFWLAAGTLGRPITLKGLSRDTAQGDSAIASILQRFGAVVTWQGDAVTVSPAPLHGVDVDMSNIPDLLPPLAVLAASAVGTTRLLNAARCRLKECDRIHGMATLLAALGVQAEETADALIIHGGDIQGGTVDSQNDHRLVMAAALAATVARGNVTILQSKAVAKSYPTFFSHYEQLGGRVK